ncbi:hypothetical protein HID58_049789, partial [Brassica napus]
MSYLVSMVSDDLVEIVLQVVECEVERHVRGVDVDVNVVLVRDLSEEHDPTLMGKRRRFILIQITSRVSRSDISQFDLVVGWFFHDSSHESSISVVGISLHHDEAVIRSYWRNPVRGSASGSFVALMQNFWSDAPMVEVQQEYESRVGAVRMKRRKEFVESLIEKGSSSHQTTVVEGQVQGQLEVESDEDEDHAILEWEARRYDDVDIRQYGSFLQGDQTMEVSDTCLGKRSREELSEESIDKFPVGKMRMSAEFNA